MKNLQQSLIYLFIFSFLLNQPLKGQECGTDALHKELMKNNPEYERNFRQSESNYVQNIYSNNFQRSVNAAGSCLSFSESDILTIPVVVHVIHIGEPIGTGTNISDAQIIGAINKANEDFRNQNGLGVDMKIRFQLALRDSNGNISSGINRVNGSSIPDYTSLGIKRLSTDAGADPKKVKNLSRWDVNKYYNIWIVNKMPSNIAGYANYPLFDYAYDGTVILSQYMSVNSSTLSHELGHGIGYLKHTFEGDENGCPSNNDCLSQGDNVCDTPPHKTTDCGTTNPCNNQGNWDNSHYNYMSYCLKNRFTQGQKDRLRFYAMGEIRSKLLFSEALIPINQPKEVGILKYNEANQYVCSTNYKPKILIKNYGTSNLTSAKFSIKVNGTQITSNFIGNVKTNDTATIELAVTPLNIGDNQIEIEVLDINNTGIDNYFLNNKICGKVSYDIFPNTSLSYSSVICYGQNEGKASITIVGDTTELKYTWSIIFNGAIYNQLSFTTNSRQNIPAGNYVVRVQKKQGCYKDYSFNISEHPEIKTSFTSENIKCYGESTGSATINASSGTDNFSYKWSNNQTTAKITGLSAGLYLVTITNNRTLCTKIDYVEIIQPPVSIITSITTENIKCYGESTGSATINATSGTDNLSYKWSNNQTTAKITGLKAGKYYVTTTNTRTLCAKVDSIELSDGLAGVYTYINKTDVKCYGNSTGIARVSAFGGNVNYKWSNNQTTDEITALKAGKYYVTTTDNIFLCFKIDSVTITQPEAITPIVSIVNVKCNGNSDGSINIKSKGGYGNYGYTWSNGKFDSVLTNIKAGIYQVTITDQIVFYEYACSTKASVTVIEPLPINILFTKTNSSGNNGSIKAIVSGGTPPYRYRWNTLVANTDSTLTGLPPGNYALIVTDANGCQKGEGTTIQIASSIINADVFQKCQVYPNPFVGTFNLDIVLNEVESIKISLYDILGHQVWEEKTNLVSFYKKEILIKNLANGIYFIKITTTKGTQTFKLNKIK